MMNIREQVAKLADKFINDYMSLADAADLGLDPRIGQLYVCESCVATPQPNDRLLRYHAGFEYLDPDYCHKWGKWVFYFPESDHDRVQEAIDYWSSETLI